MTSSSSGPAAGEREALEVLAGLSAPVYRRGLRAGYWEITRLDLLQEPEVAGAILQELAGGEPEPHELAVLLAAARAAQGPAASKRRRWARISTAQRLGEDAVRRRREEEERAQVCGLQGQLPTGKGRDLARWPTRGLRARLGGGPPAARAAAEDKERRRCNERLVSFLRAVGAPLVSAADAAMVPEMVLSRAGGGRRPSTIKSRVRMLERYWQWVMQTTSPPWALDRQTALRFAETFCEEPAHPSVPEAFLQALVFLATAGAYPPGESLAADPVLRLVLTDMVAELARTAGRVRKQALSLPAGALLALEEEVCEESSPDYQRMFAWTVLVMCWGASALTTHGAWSRPLSILEKEGWRAAWLGRRRAGRIRGGRPCPCGSAWRRGGVGQRG